MVWNLNAQGTLGLWRLYELVKAKGNNKPDAVIRRKLDRLEANVSPSNWLGSNLDTIRIYKRGRFPEDDGTRNAHLVG